MHNTTPTIARIGCREAHDFCGEASLGRGQVWPLCWTQENSASLLRIAVELADRIRMQEVQKEWTWNGSCIYCTCWQCTWAQRTIGGIILVDCGEGTQHHIKARRCQGRLWDCRSFLHTQILFRWRFCQRKHCLEISKFGFGNRSSKQ